MSKPRVRNTDSLVLAVTFSVFAVTFPVFAVTFPVLAVTFPTVVCVFVREMNTDVVIFLLS